MSGGGFLDPARLIASLRAAKKLLCLVDLDQTLLDSKALRNEVDPYKDEPYATHLKHKDFFVYEMTRDSTLPLPSRRLAETTSSNGSNSNVRRSKHIIKLRPHSREFLASLISRYYVVAYTHASLEYANEACKKLDPFNTVFGPARHRRIISKCHFPSDVGVKLLARMFARSDSESHQHRLDELAKLTIVLDDNPDVWKTSKLPVLEVLQHKFWANPGERAVVLRRDDLSKEAWARSPYPTLLLEKEDNDNLLRHVFFLAVMVSWSLLLVSRSLRRVLFGVHSLMYEYGLPETLYTLQLLRLPVLFGYGIVFDPGFSDSWQSLVESFGGTFLNSLDKVVPERAKKTVVLPRCHGSALHEQVKQHPLFAELNVVRASWLLEASSHWTCPKLPKHEKLPPTNARLASAPQFTERERLGLRVRSCFDGNLTPMSQLIVVAEMKRKDKPSVIAARDRSKRVPSDLKRLDEELEAWARFRVSLSQYKRTMTALLALLHKYSGPAFSQEPLIPWPSWQKPCDGMIERERATTVIAGFPLGRSGPLREQDELLYVNNVLVHDVETPSVALRLRREFARQPTVCFVFRRTKQKRVAILRWVWYRELHDTVDIGVRSNTGPPSMPSRTVPLGLSPLASDFELRRMARLSQTSAIGLLFKLAQPMPTRPLESSVEMLPFNEIARIYAQKEWTGMVVTNVSTTSKLRALRRHDLLVAACLIINKNNRKATKLCTFSPVLSQSIQHVEINGDKLLRTMLFDDAESSKRIQRTVSNRFRSFMSGCTKLDSEVHLQLFVRRLVPKRVSTNPQTELGELLKAKDCDDWKLLLLEVSIPPLTERFDLSAYPVLKILPDSPSSLKNMSMATSSNSSSSEDSEPLFERRSRARNSTPDLFTRPPDAKRQRQR